MTQYLKEINLDSLLQRAFNRHKIHLDFEYKLIEDIHKSCGGTEFRCELNCAELCQSDLNSRYELRINFPDKSGYVFGKMAPLLTLSLIVIIIGTGGFIYTARALWRQKKFHDTTIDFVNNMTHEFKTPISTIALSNNLIRKSIESGNTTEVSKYQDMIAQENDKLRVQVERILQLAKLESGDFNINKTAVDLKKIIDECIKKYSLLLEQGNGKVTTSFNHGDQEIKLDSGFIKDAISNLIDNSIKYSKKEPNIKIETSVSHNKLMITVSDKGIGIPVDQQKQVLKKFYRVPTGDLHDVKGFGLGLTYVDLIAKSHGGKLTIDSKPGFGSTFTIHIPVNG